MIGGGRKYSQRDLTQWPRGLGRAIAVVGLEPREIEERCGLQFSESFDDLDRFLGALVEMEDGRTFALVRHLGARTPGTEIWIDEERDHPGAELTRLMKVLGLEETALTWVTPAAEPSPKASASS